MFYVNHIKIRALVFTAYLTNTKAVTICSLLKKPRHLKLHVQLLRYAFVYALV